MRSVSETTDNMQRDPTRHIIGGPIMPEVGAMTEGQAWEEQEALLHRARPDDIAKARVIANRWAVSHAVDAKAVRHV